VTIKLSNCATRKRVENSLFHTVTRYNRPSSRHKIYAVEHTSPWQFIHLCSTTFHRLSCQYNLWHFYFDHFSTEYQHPLFSTVFHIFSSELFLLSQYIIQVIINEDTYMIYILRWQKTTRESIAQENKFSGKSFLWKIKIRITI